MPLYIKSPIASMLDLSSATAAAPNEVPLTPIKPPPSFPTEAGGAGALHEELNQIPLAVQSPRCGRKSEFTQSLTVPYKIWNLREQKTECNLLSPRTPPPPPRPKTPRFEVDLRTKSSQTEHFSTLQPLLKSKISPNELKEIEDETLFRSISQQQRHKRPNIVKLDENFNEIMAGISKTKLMTVPSYSEFRHVDSVTNVALDHSQEPMPNSVNKAGDIGKALKFLTEATGNLIDKLELHPTTLKQILDWQASASHLPLDAESNPLIDQGSDVVAQLGVTQEADPGGMVKESQKELGFSVSSYFPNTDPIPSRRAYKYLGYSKSDIATNKLETPKCLLELRESISSISMVPFVNSTCPSLPPSTNFSVHGDFSESEDDDDESVVDISDGSKNADAEKGVRKKNSVPVLTSKMKKIMRRLSDMNAIPEVINVFVENLPPGTKLSRVQLQLLSPSSEDQEEHHPDKSDQATTPQNFSEQTEPIEQHIRQEPILRQKEACHEKSVQM